MSSSLRGEVSSVRWYRLLGEGSASGIGGRPDVVAAAVAAAIAAAGYVAVAVAVAVLFVREVRPGHDDRGGGEGGIARGPLGW